MMNPMMGEREMIKPEMKKPEMTQLEMIDMVQREVGQTGYLRNKPQRQQMQQQGKAGRELALVLVQVQERGLGRWQPFAHLVVQGMKGQVLESETQAPELVRVRGRELDSKLVLRHGLHETNSSFPAQPLLIEYF
jgi:hypothetical protein